MDTNSEPKKQKKRWIIPVAIVGSIIIAIIFIIIICFIIGLIETSKPGYSTTATAQASTKTATLFTSTSTETVTPTITLTGTSTFTPTISLTPTDTLTPTETLTPTQTFTPTFTSTNTLTNTPTLTPTPAPINCRDIELARDNLTELQWENYIRDIVGKRVQFSGQVSNVYDDRRVSINDDYCQKFFTIVSLYQIPYETLLIINKDDIVEGFGTIKKVDYFLGIQIDINVTNIEIK